MQSGAGAPQGGGNGRSTASSPSSSSAGGSSQQFGFDQQRMQQRLSLQQQLLRRPEGNEPVLAYHAGSTHGVLGGASFAPPSSSMQLPQQSGKSIDLGQNLSSPNTWEEGQYRSQSVEQLPSNPVHQAYIQYAFQAAQQKSALGTQSPQQMNIGRFGTPGLDQDARVATMKMQELISMQAANQSIASSFGKSSEHLSLAEKQMDHGQPSMPDQWTVRKPSNQPTLLGQAVPVQAPQSQRNNQDMTNNSIVAAQMKAIQALAHEHDIDLSHPANSNLMTQLIPVMQSRVIEQLKANESNLGGQPSYVPMLKQHFDLPQVASGNSSSDMSVQSGSKPRQTVSTNLLGVALHPAPRQPFPTGNRMNLSPSLVNVNQRSDYFSLGNFFPAGSEFLQMQNPRQLNQVSLESAASSNDVGSGNALASQGGPTAKRQHQHSGLTEQQSQCLMAQILAFRKIKRNERISCDTLKAIVPPPLERQMQQAFPSAGTGILDRSDGKHVGNHIKNFVSSEKGTESQTSAGPLVSSREEAGEEERLAASSATTRGVCPTSGEPLVIISTRKEEQLMYGSGKLHREPERVTEKTPTANDFAADRGKSIASPPSVHETAHVKKVVKANDVTQHKEGSLTRKYHGPLFDFPVFTRKHDTFASSIMMNNNSNLMLAYDIKDLLIEEDVNFLKRKREKDIKKIGDILAVNLQRKRIKPDLVLRLQIEEKKLQLADVQARIRYEIEQQQQEILAMPDRPYRKFVRLCEHQRQYLARQVQASQKAVREKHIKSIFQWRKKLFEAHWASRDARTTRNRGIAKYHERMLREFSKRKDDDRNKRMEALKNNDVERYREMLLEQQTKIPGDTAERYAVLSSFLTQTEEYLQKLGSKIMAAKSLQEVEEAASAAASAARAQGLSEDEVRAAAACAREQVMIRNRFTEMNAPRDSSSVNKYYNLAHAVNERVVRQPSMLQAGTLRDYQLVGLQWMLSLYNNKLNGILADEMGLGKTVQVMALIAYLMEFKGNYGPHLIIVPNAVLVNWKSELRKWLPSVSCIYYVGGKDERSKLFSQEVMAMKFNVLVTTYEFIMFDRAKLSRIDWKYIIIDEAQRMKDRESVLARDMDKYRCQRRLLLTGTPLQNDLKELWSLLNLLLPEVFDNRKAFHDWFSQPFQKGGPTHNCEDDWLETEKKIIIIHRLHQILEPFMLRRRVEDVEGSLPPKVSIVLRCRMSAVQSAIYDWIKSTGTLRVDPDEEERKTQRNRNYQLKTYKTLNNRCMELRKACNHPLLNYPNFYDFSKDFLVRSCGKLWVLDRILIKLQRTGHRVLLFSTMTKLLDILEEYLEWRELVYRRIDGTTSLEDRESAIVDFNSPDTDCFIFLLSIRAAGRGLNLQSADTVIIYDPDPNPKNEEQAVARAHRIGQTREVKVIYMEAVVDKISSHQKEDEFQSGGIVDYDDDLAGKDRYMGSIESLIRKNIQQHKIDMANEIINAGRFDQRTTHEERRLTLESLLHDEEKYQERVHDVPSLQQMNRMIARSKEEVELFDQIDEELEWTEMMTGFDQVPQWLRPSTKETNAAIGNLSKKPSKKTYGMDANELASKTEKRKVRPKGKKIPTYTELKDGHGEFSETSSRETNGYDEEGEDEDGIRGAVVAVPLNEDNSDEGDAISGEGSDWLHASESTKNNCVVEEACSSGSRSDEKIMWQKLSPSVSQKFGLLSALDARPGSRSKRMSDELEEGEIAASGDSHMDVQQSSFWIHDRDEGEDEKVFQPKIKRKRSVRVRPQHAAERREEKINESQYLCSGDSRMPFQADQRYESQNRGHKALAEPSASKNDSLHSSLKNVQDLSSKKVSRKSKFHASPKSGRGSGISSANDASEHSRDTPKMKVMNGSRISGKGTKMPEAIQRKCKSVITRLQKKIDKEGQDVIPLFTEFLKISESSSAVCRPEDNLLDLHTIALRVKKSYSGVSELVADMLLILKNAIQYYGFSREVKYEAETVHDLIFNILEKTFPEMDFREARDSFSFSSPVSAASSGSPPRQMIAAPNKRGKPINDEKPGPLPLKRPRTLGPVRIAEEVKSMKHGPQKERHNNSSTCEIGLQDAQSTHPGDLVICKKKRKDREKSAVKPVSASASPVSPTEVDRSMRSPVDRSMRSPRTVQPVKGVRLGQHSTQQQGWASQSPQQGSSSGSGIGWAHPVKKMRTGAVKRRPSHL